jgi:hypothetical protein
VNQILGGRSFREGRRTTEFDGRMRRAALTGRCAEATAKEPVLQPVCRFICNGLCPLRVRVALIRAGL